MAGRPIMHTAVLHAVRPSMAVSDVAVGRSDLGSYIAGAAMNGCIERRPTCQVGAVCRVTRLGTCHLLL